MPVLQTADYVESEISTIGNNVEQNFAFHPDMARVRQKQVIKQLVKSYYKPVKSSALPKQMPLRLKQTYADPVESVSSLADGLGDDIGVDLEESPHVSASALNKRKPTLRQIVFLLRNHRNPYPNAMTRAKVILSSGGASGVSGLITLKQMVGCSCFV